LGIIVILTTVAFALLTAIFSAQPIIRGATLAFLWMILLGCLIMGLFIIIAPLAPQMTNCTAQLWLVHFGYLLIVFPIAGKTWRIYNIFFRARKRLEKSNWNTSRLFIIFVVIPFLGILIYLIVWTVVRKPTAQYNLDSSGIVYQSCEYSSAFSIISMVAGIAFLLWIVQLAVSVRGVPKNFNESRWLGASVYTISIVFLFVIPLAVLHNIYFVDQRTFVSVGCFIVTESVLLFLFSVKFVKIWTGTAQKPAKKPKSSGQEASSVVSSTGKESVGESSAKSGKSGTADLARMGSTSAGSEDGHHRSMSEDDDDD